jgi:hypothetical protein
MSARRALRERTSRWYRGELHFLFTFSLSLGATGFLLSRLRQVRPAEWLALPLFFLFCCFAEYLEHRYLLYQRRFGEFAFRTHTLEHHSFFTIDSRRDFAYVLFPPLLVLGYLGLVVRRSPPPATSWSRPTWDSSSAPPPPCSSSSMS